MDFIVLQALKGVIVSSIKNTEKSANTWIKALMEHREFIEQLEKYGIEPEDFQRVPIYTCICSFSTSIAKNDSSKFSFCQIDCSQHSIKYLVCSNKKTSDEDCNLIINKEDLKSLEDWWLKNINQGLPSITDIKQFDAMEELAAKLAAFNSNPFQDNEWQKVS